ncbi:unnamed protein product [Brugia timori]|uniref:Uncharacterized protein n=1 Tax=Brugia timori TaxID=42155 RepID=A0A0R3RCY9_9BILA|nr:unnamed protein product [Brugia timori]
MFKLDKLELKLLNTFKRSVRQEDETERSHRYNRTKGRYQHSEILSGNKISLPPVYARSEHTAKTNERSGVKRSTKSEMWEDSDISYGDGSFISETQTSTEFTAKKGERYDTKRPVESDLWKVCFILINKIVKS